MLLAAACGRAPQPLTPPLQPGWNEIKMHGDTVCARGGPYSIFVAPGKSNKVVIDFIGGGACWTERSCRLGAGALFDDSIDSLRARVAHGYPGVYDLSKPDNPFRDWFHVTVPYCTGDIHWGNSVATYGTGSAAFVIRHKGAVNARAALEWVYANFPAPERIFVTGCSAGSYGSILWAPYIKQHYGATPLAQLGDSGAGVVTPSFSQDGFPKWNALEAMPAWIPSLDPARNDVSQLGVGDMYARIGAFYPDVPLAEFNTRLDGTQSFFYNAMGGGDANEWSRKMLASIASIHAALPTFHSYIADGNQHCVLPDDDYDTLATGGVKFLDWLDGYLDGAPPADVACPACVAK